MRLIVFCLGLLLATPAAANSVEDALCGPVSAPVARMDSSEKLCRATVRSFSELLAATHAELVSDAHLLEVKHVASPESSPYVPGSSCPEPIRLRVREELIQQLHRYAAIIRDPKTPAVGVELITNDIRAASYFEGLMTESGVQGRVVVRP